MSGRKTKIDKLKTETFRGFPIFARTKKDGIIVIYSWNDMGNKYKWYSKHDAEDGNCRYIYGGAGSSLIAIMTLLNNSYYVRTEGWEQL